MVEGTTPLVGMVHTPALLESGIKVTLANPVRLRTWSSSIGQCL